MRRALILGFGNTLRRDDGVGVVAAQRLKETVDKSRVRVIACHQLTVDLAKDISKVDRVIMIDADQKGTPGLVTVTKIKLENSSTSTYSHELDPATLIGCSKALYGKSPETFLITITGESFDFGEGVSKLVSCVLPEALERAMQLAMFAEKTKEPE